MTNKEYYAEQILDIVCNGERIAFNKDTNKLCTCSSISCRHCIFHDTTHGKCCSEMTKEWCNEEYVEPCPFEEGELVEVSDDGIIWQLAFFSHINNDNNPYKYKTYYTTNRDAIYVYNWKYCQKYGTLGGLIKESNKE